MVKRDEDLKVGDVIKLWCGTKRITRLEAYRGPLDCIIGIAHYEPGPTRALSLERGGMTEVLDG